MFFRMENEGSSWMEAAGLKTIQDFSEKSVGDLISRDHKGRELRRISATVNGVCREFYLKRIGREPIVKLVQMMLFGCRPLCGPMRELRMLRMLQDSDFTTMNPVAYGEKRFFGWPVGGFLVVDAVQGVEVADLVAGRGSVCLQDLFFHLGVYLARLHKAGFLQVVRLKDLFCTSVTSYPSQPLEFALIDRETSKPWRKRASKIRCFRAMARISRRIRRDGYRIGHGELRKFFKGYLSGGQDIFGSMDLSDFRKQFFRHLRRELENTHK